MRYTALLRGINVGGKTMMKMETLRAAFSSLGFENVKSYINSGNLAFDTVNGDEGELTAKIEKRIETEFGRAFPVMIRDLAEIQRILANNPFDGEYASHKEMHVLFLKEEMAAEKIDQLMNAAGGEERFAVHSREIYCHLPFGVADSLLGKGFIDKKLKVVVTGRNWRTVEKLAAL